MQNETSKPTVERKGDETTVMGSTSLKVVVCRIDDEHVSMIIEDKKTKPLFCIVLSYPEAQAIGEALKNI